MRALSIRQPHAKAILRAVKKIEFRSGLTNVRGRVLIYASPQRYSSEEEQKLMAKYGIADISCDELPRGVIVGSMELYECKREPGGPFPWGWHVRNPMHAKQLRKPRRRANAV